MREKTYLIAIAALLLVVLGISIYGVVGQNKTNEVKSSTEPSVEVTAVTGTSTAGEKPQTVVAKTIMKHTVTIKTNYGNIEFETYDSDAPKTVANFINLAEKGFYNKLTFHRIIKGFMIQGGDPYCSSATSTGSCGTGGPGYQFEDELNPNTDSYKAGYVRGVVAMANAGPNTNGSQFFIMHQDYSLPHNYTIFGKVTSGMDTVDKIANLQTNPANNKPLSPVIIEEVTVKSL